MLFLSRFLPCGECGASVERTRLAEHRCDPDRRVEFTVFGMREGIARFDRDLHAYLRSAHGRFEAWYAARQVRPEAG